MSVIVVSDVRVRIEGDTQDFGPDNRKFILELPGESAEFDITPLLVKEAE